MAKLTDRYAIALLELSEDKESLETDLTQATLVRDSLENDDVQAFLKHPHISNTAKQTLFQEAFSNHVVDHLIGFLYLMVKKNREAFIVPALTEYIDRANRRLGKLKAEIVSAKPLKAAQIESIRTLLTKQRGMDVEVNAITDPDVIGGFYILVDGHIFDGTVRSKLNEMRERLKRGGFQ